MPDTEKIILAKEWFYEYELPSGARTKTYIPPEIARIHTTRLNMMFSALDQVVGTRWPDTTCIDLGCHQGYFSFHLARRCEHVLGVDYQQEHIDDCNLIKSVYGLTNAEFVRAEIADWDVTGVAPADVVVMFGLLYNLEDPIRVLRKARKLAKRVLLVETQTTGLDLSGRVDSGSHLWGNEMHGCFGIFSGLPGVKDGSASDIILYPSPKGLVWILEKLGFSRVEVLKPPADAYEQLLTGKRIMVAAHV